jgi:KaiC/GvpD/RAD55 family RecA-like ATPase
MPINSAIMHRSEEGNDTNDNRNDKGYLGRIKPEPTSLQKLLNLSATNRIIEMEANLKNDVYIFPDLALSGQITLFYAWSNTGKTLFFFRFIKDAITEGRIKAEDVIYVNADDSYKGLYTKVKLASEFGFNIISPQEAGVSPNEVLELLEAISKDNEADGKVIIIDTLKKFADMMSKRSQADLYENFRRFIAKGGTVIIAGHANKHKVDGNLVYEGTSDTMNDVDCVYSMYRMSDPQDENQIVEFRREKDRGNVVPKVSYKYQKSQNTSYIDMLSSITRMNDNEATEVATNTRNKELKEKYEVEILFVSGLLKENGVMNQSAILQSFKGNSDLSGEITGRSLRTALSKLTDKVWTAKRGAKNALFFNLIGADAKQYRRASRNE